MSQNSIAWWIALELSAKHVLREAAIRFHGQDIVRCWLNLDAAISAMNIVCG